MAPEVSAEQDDLKAEDQVIVDDELFKIGPDDVEDEAEAKKSDEDDEEGGKPDGKEKGERKEEKRLLDDDAATLKARVERLEADKSNLKKALHEERQAKKKSKAEDTEETQLTDAQLLAIMKEHQDDPSTMFNIIKHVATQAAKGIKKEALSEADVKNRSKQAESFLRERIPQLYEEDSDVRLNVNKVRDDLGLDDDPVGDYLAAGVIALNRTPELAEYWYKKGKADALGQKGREKDIADGGLTPSGKKAGKPKVTLTKDMEDLAQQMGLTPSQRKLYAKLRSAKGPASINMED